MLMREKIHPEKYWSYFFMLIVCDAFIQGSYKISALKMQYEIFVSTQWLDLKLRKLKFEEKVYFDDLKVLRTYLYFFRKS